MPARSWSVAEGEGAGEPVRGGEPDDGMSTRVGETSDGRGMAEYSRVCQSLCLSLVSLSFVCSLLTSSLHQHGLNCVYSFFILWWLDRLLVALLPRARPRVGDAAARCLDICRKWLFTNDGPDVLQISPGVFSEAMFQAVVFVLYD